MAVSSYKFIGMYVLIGFLVGILSGFSNSTVPDDSTNYNFYQEVIYTNEQIIKNSDTLVKSDNYIINKAYGDEVAQQKNIGRILLNSALPTKLIPANYDASDFERTLDKMFQWFRGILLLFAGFELFQIIFNKKTD